MTPKASKRLARAGKSRIRLHFLGATRMVTGSLHFFEYTSEEGITTRFFVDMGLNQEVAAMNRQNRLPSGIKPSQIDFGIFSHAHIDHTGFFPKLVKDGFTGPVYTTAPTKDLLSLLLPDSGYLQEKEALSAQRRAERKDKTAANTPAPAKKRPGKQSNTAKSSSAKAAQPTAVQPLYTEMEARACLGQIKCVEYDTLTQLADGIQVKFTNAAHILGAAVVTLELGKRNQKRTVVLTGDIGRPDMPVLQDVAQVKQADYIICEGTYGDKLHEKRNRLAILAEIINKAYKRANVPHQKFGYGVIIMPAFAVGRVQSVLFDLRQLMAEKAIPEIPVFVDSPMAISATRIHRNHPDHFNQETSALVKKGIDPFTTPRYAELEDFKLSQQLDQPASSPVIIVGSSGMASGGRILAHLEARLPGPQHTIVFVGYQGTGTLGRQLVEPGVDIIKINGKILRVNATIESMSDYSGHGDYGDIMRWLSGFQRKPRQLFLVHGEAATLEALKGRVERTLRFEVTIPRHRDHVDLD